MVAPENLSCVQSHFAPHFRLICLVVMHLLPSRAATISQLIIVSYLINHQLFL